MGALHTPAPRIITVLVRNDGFGKGVTFGIINATNGDHTPGGFYFTIFISKD
jgi:hypothetical protein